MSAQSPYIICLITFFLILIRIYVIVFSVSVSLAAVAAVRWGVGGRARDRRPPAYDYDRLMVWKGSRGWAERGGRGREAAETSGS